MCLACQMDDELWFAYLDQVAAQEKAAAAEAADRDKTLAADAADQEKTLVADATDQEKTLAADATLALPAKPEQPKPAPASPFACEELPSE